MTLPFERDEFVAFLLRAKCATYASADDSAKVPALLPGAVQMEYREGPWFYRDSYFGAQEFTGQEVVYYRDTPVWTMVYNGGMLDPGASLDGFLREAMNRITAACPYRGPEEYRRGDYRYTDESHGTLERFWGYEVICYQDRPIYDLRYSGGVIK